MLFARFKGTGQINRNASEQLAIVQMAKKYSLRKPVDTIATL